MGMLGALDQALIQVPLVTVSDSSLAPFSLHTQRC